MVNIDCQLGMRADEHTFMNMPLASAPRPHVHDEYPAAWISEKNPPAEEGPRGDMNVFTSLMRNDWAFELRRRKGMPGTALSEVPGVVGERHDWPWPQSGTMVDGMLTILLGIGSTVNVVGLKTAQTFERAPRSHGHGIKKLNLSRRLYVSGVGHGAAVCD
eukprot:9270485-Pyramimonas_sp.AAC.1